MINLDTLNFSVETKELDAALTKVTALAKSLGDLSAVTKVLDGATRAETKARQEANAEKRASDKAANDLIKSEKKVADEAIKSAKVAQAEVEKAQKATQAATEKAEKARTRALEKEAAARLKEEKKATAEIIAEAEKQAKAAEKASQRASKAAEKAAKDQAKAVEVAAQAQVQAQLKIQAAQQASEDKVAKLQERLNNTFRDIAGGFTKGESSVLNFARSLGLTETQLDPIKGQLQDIGKLLSNPFDSAIGAIRSINKETEVLTNRMDLASQGISLTAKQLKEFSRIQTELEASFKAGGADIVNDPDSQRLFNEQLYSTKVAYLEIAKANNAKLQAEKESNVQIGRAGQLLDKQDQALTKLTKELERSQRAVDGLNDGLQVSNSNRLLNFERMLTASGVSAVDAAAKLELYKKNLEAVQAVQQRADADSGQRRRDFLSRSLAPQVSDSFVSIAGGMPIMTVLMQQGAQVRDLIQQSGVGANELSSVLKQTGEEFIATLAGAAGAMGNLFVGVFESAAVGIGDFVAGLAGMPDLLTGLGTVATWAETQLNALGVSTTSLGAFFSSLIPIIGNLMVAAIATFTVVVGSAIVATYQFMTAMSDMKEVLALSGASTGLTSAELLDLAIAADTAGASLVDTIEIFNQLIKIGGIPTEVFASVTQAMVALSRVSSLSIEDLVEQYKKLAKDPVKSLNDLAIATGKVTQAEINRVARLIDAGRETEALIEATDAYTKALNANTREIELSSGSLTSLWNVFKSALVDTWGNMQTLGATAGVTFALLLIPRTILLGIAQLNTALMQLKFLFIGVATIAGQFFQDLASDRTFAGTRQAASDLKGALDILGGQYGELTERIFELGEYSQEYKEAELKRIAELDKAASDAASNRDKEHKEEIARRDQLIKRTTQEVRSDALASGDIETLRGLTALSESTKRTELQVSVLAKLQENTDKVNNVNRQYINDLKAINDLRNLGGLTPEKYQQAIAMAEAARAKDTKSAVGSATVAVSFFQKTMDSFNKDIVKSNAALHELTDAHKNYNLALSSKEYDKMSTQEKELIRNKYLEAQAIELLADKEELRLKVMKDLQETQLRSLGFTSNYAEQIKLLNYALDNNAVSTEEYGRLLEFIQKNQPYYKDTADALKKINEESDKLLASLDEQLTTELGIADSIELQLSLLGKTEEESKRAIGLLKIKLDYEKEIADIKTKGDTISPEAKLAAEAKALAIRRQQELNLNSEISADAATKQFEEFEKIQKDISDVIFTAITEGGKAAGDKLRDILKQALNKRLTVFIDAVVKDITGGFFGGSGQAGESGAQSSGTNTTLGGSLASSFNNAFTKFANSSVGEKIGLSEKTYTEFGQIESGLSDMGKSFSEGMQIAGKAIGNATTALSISSAISGGYKTGADSFVKAATAIGSYFDPTGGYIAGAISGAFNRAFGRKLVGTGIQGTFGGTEGFEGNRFEDLKGGWFRSDKTKTSALDEQTTAFFKDSFNALRVETGIFATALGLNADSIADFSSKIKLNLKDLSPEEADKKIKEAFATVSDELAAAVLGSDSFTKAGETASQTLLRLGTSLLTVNSWFDLLGKTALESSLEGADLASTLADAFGGLDQLSASTKSYYESFYTEQERTDTSVRQLTTALADLGETLPDVAAEDAVSQYRALVDAQDINTESGRKAYAALIQLSPAFIAVTDAVKAAKEQQESLASAYTSLDLSKASSTLGSAVLETIMGKSSSQIRRMAFDYVTSLDSQTKAGAEAIAAFEKLTPAIDFFIEAASESDEMLLELALLQADLTELQGDFAIAAEMRYAIETQGMNEAEIAAYNLASSLRNQVAAATQAISLQERLNAVTLTSAEIRERERNALDESNRKMFDLVTTLEDLAKINLSNVAAIGGVKKTIFTPGQNSSDVKTRVGAAFASVGIDGIPDLATYQQMILDYEKLAPIATKLLAEAAGSLHHFKDAFEDGWDSLAPGTVEAMTGWLKDNLGAALPQTQEELDRIMVALTANATNASETLAVLLGVADDYANMNNVVEGAVQPAEEVVKAIEQAAKTLDDVNKRLKETQADIARFDMTSFEVALLEIQERADEAAEAFGSLAPEIEALAAAERELLNLRNARSAAETVSGLNKEVSQLGLTDLEKELAGIADQADDYIRGLVDIGQATDSNITAVKNWSQAMRDAAIQADAATVASEAVDKAYATLERSVEAQRKTINTQLEAANDLATEVSSIFDMLKQAVDDLYGSVDSTAKQSAKQARAFISQSLAGALATGSLPESKALGEAITNARAGLDSNLYATKFESDRDRLLLAIELKQLQDIAGTQLTEAERQIRLLQSQLESLDDILRISKEQIDAMRGIDTSVMSVEAAVAALGVAITAGMAAIAASAGAKTPASTLPAYATQPYSTEDTPGMRDVKVQAQTGVDYSKSYTPEGAAAAALYASVTGGANSEFYNNALAGIGGSFANIGWDGSREGAEALFNQYSFDVGTNNVPYDMTARIHEGEMIVPKAFNPATSGLMNDNSDLVEQLEMMRFELRANVVHTSKLAKQLERLTVPTNDGEALQTKAVV